MKLFVVQGDKSAALVSIGADELPITETPIEDILDFLGNTPPKTFYKSAVFMYYENYEYRASTTGDSLLVDDNGAWVLESRLLNRRGTLPPDHNNIHGLFLIDSTQHLVVDDEQKFLIEPI